jgi:hypothetical protein
VPFHVNNEPYEEWEKRQPPEVAAVVRRAFEKSSFGIPVSVAPDDFYLLSRFRNKKLPFRVRFNCLLHFIT